MRDGGYIERDGGKEADRKERDTHTERTYPRRQTFTTTDMPFVDKIIQHGEAVDCQSFGHNNFLISDFFIRVYIMT